jgi:hypothetical protein
MPTISVKTSFQQKSNVYTPISTIPKPSISSVTSVSKSTSNQAISKDTVSISDAARKAQQSLISQNNASKTLTNQISRSVSPSVITVPNIPGNHINSKDTVSISDAARKAQQSLISQNNASKTIVNTIIDKTSQISAVIQGIANKSSGNSEVRTTANTYTKTANTTQTSAVVYAAAKKSDTTDLKTLVNNLEKLEKLTSSYLTSKKLQENPKSYVPSKHKPSEINDYNLEFIRYNSEVYTGTEWAVTAGAIDTKHVKYVESKSKNLDKFFEPKGQGAFLKDPVTGNKIDFLHMAATIDGILTKSPVPDDLAGWAGDLQTAILDLQSNTKDSNNLKVLQKEAKKVIGGNSSFSTPDILADVDAVNIANMLKENPKLLLSDAIEKYYSKSGDVNRRFSEFIESFGGKKEFKEAVYDVDLKTGLLILKDDNILHYGTPTDNQVKAIRGAFIDYIFNQAAKEKK